MAKTLDVSIKNATSSPNSPTVQCSDSSDGVRLEYSFATVRAGFFKGEGFAPYATSGGEVEDLYKRKPLAQFLIQLDHTKVETSVAHYHSRTIASQRTTRVPEVTAPDERIHSRDTPRHALPFRSTSQPTGTTTACRKEVTLSML